VQGNIDQGEKWNEERRDRILEIYTRLSEEAASQGAEWIVWPETAVPGLIEADPSLSARLSQLARRTDADFVVGAMGIAPDESGTRIGAFFDSAFVLDSEGRIVDRYDKAHLVPFGEFVPLRALLGKFFQSLASGLSTMDVTPGPAPRVSLIDVGQAGEPPLRVAIPICYELLFPHLVRGFGADGAGVLLAITNDAWYGRTGAPHQFLAMTALRSAENGLWAVRAANTGISAIIDARGRVQQRSALFEEAVLLGEIPVVRVAKPTFYARHGDVFAWICILGSVGAIGRSRLTGRRGWGGDEPAAVGKTDENEERRDRRE
jgi:apolipoprotein N-acyltransferase